MSAASPVPPHERSPDAGRVVVTGLGVLSPAGVGVDALRRWRAQGSPAARIPDFDATRYVASVKLLRSMHRTFHVAAAAAVLAMRAAGLPDADSLPAAGIAPERAGIAAALADLSPVTSDLLRVLASMPAPAADAELDWSLFAERGVHELHPFRRLTLLANMAAAHTSLLFNFQGPSFTFTSGAEAGLQTVSEAFWTIREGHADLMVCEAADAPEQTFLPAAPPELGAALILEGAHSARRRHAQVLAEILAPQDGDPAMASPLPCDPARVSYWRPPSGSLVAAVEMVAAAGGAAVSLSRLLAAATPAVQAAPLAAVSS